MPFLLRITDQSATVTISGSEYPTIGATYFPSSGDGVTVTETATIICEGTASAIIAQMNRIEGLFADAALRKSNPGPKVYVECAMTGSSGTQRSELQNGIVQWSQAPLRHKLGSTVDTVEIAVIWTRLDWWESSIENELFLSSGTTGEKVGGVDVYNNDNSSSSTNWVGIASNRVDGAMPAPLRLRILNASGGSVAPHNWHIGHNVNSSPSSLDCWLLASEASGGASASWSTITHQTLSFIWSLSSTLLSQAQG